VVARIVQLPGTSRIQDVHASDARHHDHMDTRVNEAQLATLRSRSEWDQVELVQATHQVGVTILIKPHLVPAGRRGEPAPRFEWPKLLIEVERPTEAATQRRIIKSLDSVANLQEWHRI
jgi:hypothetical protein